jgi:hypothetical protein
VSPVKYEQGSYIPEDDILYSHRRENLNLASVLLALLPKYVHCVPLGLAVGASEETISIRMGKIKANERVHYFVVQICMDTYSQ